MQKLKDNEEWRENGEIKRKWRQNEGEKEFYLCISLSLLQNIKISHILSQTLKYVTFCCKLLKYTDRTMVPFVASVAKILT